MTTISPPDQSAWQCLRPEALAQRLAGVDLPWCVVGGWALDLWHGRETREHEDLEFTVLPQDVSAFRRALAPWEFHAVVDGATHYLPAAEEPDAEVAQVWCHDIEADCWRADMMIERGTATQWVYKRDPRLTRPRADMVARTPEGIPYLRPAGVLLFKAKYCRPKEEKDFRLALPRLAPDDRAWLKAALAGQHPGHAWGTQL